MEPQLKSARALIWVTRVAILLMTFLEVLVVGPFGAALARDGMRGVRARVTNMALAGKDVLHAKPGDVGSWVQEMWIRLAVTAAGILVAIVVMAWLHHGFLKFVRQQTLLQPAARPRKLKA